MTFSKRAFVTVLIVASVSVVASAQARVDGQSLMTSVQTLASAAFEGRRTGTLGGLKARAWVVEQFKSAGLAPLGPDFVAPFTFSRGGTEFKDAANIVGVCKGRAAARDVIVVSAHYDHVGVRNGEIFYGADDNASGVAVLLEIGRHCARQPFTHDVIFAAFDAEELGLQGAKAFVAMPPIAKERIALNINLDMVARGDKGELYATGTTHWPALRPTLERIAKTAAIKLLLGHDQRGANGNRDDWTNQSDHGAFHAAGIPFVYFGVEDHPDYHKATDTADKIDPTFFKQAAETILDAVTALDALATFTK